MTEQQVIEAFQQEVAKGRPAAQVAQQFATLYPQYAQRLQQLAGGQPGNPEKGAVTPPVAQASPEQAQAAQQQAQQPARPLGPGNPPTYWKDPGERQNSNAAGVQSNGDDDPWLIGAGIGTTYSPEVMYRWYQKAKAGDGKAAYVLRQVGFFDEQNRPKFTGKDGLEQWAASRHLDRKADASAKSPWYHDPGNYGQAGFRDEKDAVAAHTATPWAQTRGGPNDGPSSWAPPTTTQANHETGRETAPMTAERGDPPSTYPQEEKADGTVGHSDTPIDTPDPKSDPDLAAQAEAAKRKKELEDEVSFNTQRWA